MLVINALEIVIYQEVDGEYPFQQWSDALDRAAAGKVTVALRRMAQGNLGDTKSVGAGVVERRVDWGPGYRIYFGRDGDRLIVLLGGGTKKHQQRDIEEAHGRWADYQQRRKDEEIPHGPV